MKKKDINAILERTDRAIIRASGSFFERFARCAFFVVFFWFGILKVFSLSPANPLVADLLERTLPGLSFDTFIVAFGVFEMIIGILFIIPRLERLAIGLLAIHMITTAMPLFLLPAVAWQGTLVPTLEGQYIIKNLALIALAMAIAGKLRPFNFELHKAHRAARAEL